MVKSGVSKKQSKASGSVNPTGSDSPSIASSNFRAVFEDHPSYNAPIKLMIKFLKNHPLFGPFDAFTDVVPVSTLFNNAFSAYRPLENPQEVHLNLINGSLVILSKEKFLTAINLLVHPSIKFFSPSMGDITSALYQMGYQKPIRGIGEFKKNQLPVVWQLCATLSSAAYSTEPEALTTWDSNSWNWYGASSPETTSTMGKSFGMISFSIFPRSTQRKTQPSSHLQDFGLSAYQIYMLTLG